MTTPHMTRRSMLLTTLGAVAGILAPGLADAATDLPKLTESDTAAKALGYAEIAANLDSTKEATYQKGRTCSGCVLYQVAQEHGSYAPCAAFPGKSVSSAGWCRAFSPKPAG